MAELFTKGREALGALSEESATVLRQVETWRGQIAGYTTAQQCNDAIPLMNALAPILQVQVKPLLMARAAELKLTFDKGKKLFVALAPEPVGA